MRDHDPDCQCGRCREDREDSPRRNEWNLPHGTEPHNPDNLTPEQITEGGKYRAVTLEECDGRHEGLIEAWWHEGWCMGAGKSSHFTYRVSITTPLPAVKESLTPQPATGQSKTPRTDEESSLAYLFPSRCEVVHTYFARTLETELTAALAERDEARRLLGEAKAEIVRLVVLSNERVLHLADTAASEELYLKIGKFIAVTPSPKSPTT